jgi:caa(3)-type oxidase subunit IV
MNDAAFSRELRWLLIAWAALIALMLASLGSAYLHLGAGNAATGVVIAVIKSAIVVALFMRLARASALLRIVAAAALVIWLLMVGLSGVDFATRRDEPALTQPPQQLPPLHDGRAR